MTQHDAIVTENATPRDAARLAHLLAESLFDDPLQRWLFPDESRRSATSAWMFRRLLKPKIARGLIRVIRVGTGEVASVAVWTPPNPPAPSRWEHYADSLFMRWIYGRRIHEIRAGFSALANRHPPQPYWYLQALATSPEYRGRGHAKQLLEEKFRECNVSGLLMALETSNTTNLTYYQKRGFQVSHELTLVDGLPVWLMCRTSNSQTI